MHTFGRLAFASVSLLAFAVPAMAQDAGSAASDEASFDASDIIVQARRKDEDIQDVPLVVQAVSGDQMQGLEIRRFEDVTSVVPGLQLQANANGLGTTASLRGVNFDANASGASTTVEFYRNDAVISSGALFQALYDIGQVEVLRGPQGTLRGRASPSGSITLTTRRPDLGEVGGYASATATDEHRWNVNGAVNVPIVADKLGVRVAGYVSKDRGNGIHGVNVRTGAEDREIFEKSQAIRASVRADPFEGLLLLDFNYEGIRRENRQYDQVQSFSEVLSTAAASPLTIRAKDRKGVGAYARTTDQTYKIFNWQAQLNLLGQKLTYVGADVKGDIFAEDPQDDAGFFASPFAISPPNLPFVQDSTNRTKQVTHEIRLQNEERIAGMFDYVIGGLDVKSTSPTLFYGNTGIAAPGFLVAVVHTGRLRYRADREKSLFGNLTVHLGENTELSGGLRKIWFKADSGIRVDVVPGSNRSLDPANWMDIPSIRRCLGHSDVPGCLPQKKATIYSFNAKHNFTENLMVYASYGSSWRPGNSVVGFSGVPSALQNQFLNLPDEKSKSYEIGVKSSWLDNRLRFNISAYQQKFSNYAYRLATPVISLAASSPVPVLAPGFNFVAPVPAKVKGFEADLAFDVTSNLKLGASVSFADGKITNALFPCVDLNDDNVPDITPPTPDALFAHVGTDQIDTCTGNASPSSAPRWAGTVTGEYNHPLGDNLDGYVRGLLNWKGNSAGDGLNPYDSVKSFGLLNVYAGLRDPDGAWEVSLFAKNLTGTNRVLSRSNGALVTPLRGGIPLGPLGTSINSTNATNYLGITTTEPREFGINLKVAFGSR